VRADSALVAKNCREAVDLLVSAHGTSSLADSNRLQRLWRDIHVASHHAITEWQVNLEIYGKALLGVEPNITPLIDQASFSCGLPMADFGAFSSDETSLENRIPFE
jgi:3-hydroxy-9,10-secoandrosta-1,3,5(10)-triene-9,17-dione monooxygenase